MFDSTSFFDGGYMDTFIETLEETTAVLAAVNLIATVLPQLPLSVQDQVLDACERDGIFAVARQIVS